MKKIIALLLAVVMVFALVACASTAKTEEKTDAPAPAETTNEETTAPAEETDAPAEEETAEPAGDAVGTDIKIGVVLIGDENEGYTYSHIKGIQEAAKALGISENNIVWKYSIGEDESCYDACVDCVDQGCQIVITNSYGHQSFCRQAAEEYPDVQFVAMTGDTARADGLANFHNAFTGIYEARYVGGVVAGMKLQQLIDEGKVEDKNKTADGKIKIGYVGAYPYAEVVSGYTAFFLGLQSIVPDVAMQVQYTNSWFNITAENEAAVALIADGCCIIGQHADSTGAPAATQKLKDSGKICYSVGYNIDMLATAPTAALTSATNVWKVYYKELFEGAQSGNIPQDWCKGYEDGAVAITDLGPEAAEGTADKVAEVEAALKDGSLHVFDTSKFTVDGAEVTTAPIDLTYYDYSTGSPVAVYQGETKEAISDGYFHEGELRAAPTFALRIDGIIEDADPVA
ncbi:MAG: BMP family ABC transporter substrate-binding protein [Oscillospiraceae bacterium]|nr:BMP family ABC transporter substrate-binding protein [Oscillospiraceae bacterium]